jgi:hypothetical protein
LEFGRKCRSKNVKNRATSTNVEHGKKARVACKTYHARAIYCGAKAMPKSEGGSSKEIAGRTSGA